MSASSFLSYGGVLKVARVDGATLNNANAAPGYASTTGLKIKNYDDYGTNHSGEAVEYVYGAKNPGSWANGLKICTIDDFADQTIGINTTDLAAAGAVVGYGVTTTINGILPGAGTTEVFNGYVKGIITGVTTSTSGASTVDVKVVSRVSAAGTETKIAYGQGNALNSFETADTLFFVNNSGTNVGEETAGSAVDWYDQQTLGLTNSTVYWKTIAPKPVTNQYSVVRNGYGDGLHVAVVDDTGSVTGIQGNILEKHTGLSKAADSISSVNSPQKIWYKNYLRDFSENVYAGYNPSQAVDAYHGTVPVAPVLVSVLLIAFIHDSNAFLSMKLSSLMTVTVHVSKVLSPATFKIRPLKGTGISAMLEAGSCAPLHMKRNISPSWLAAVPSQTVSARAVGNVGISTSNRLGRAPPPASFVLKSVIVLSVDIVFFS